jgi:hypothetical protein
MKRFLLVLAFVAVAGATYVAMASGSQTAGPTARQFAALKRQVAKLQKDDKLLKQVVGVDALLIYDCMAIAVPVGRFGDTANSPTYGYTYTPNGGVPGFKPALDLTSNDDPTAIWMTGAPAAAGGGSACQSDINSAALRKAARLEGIHLRAAPRAFSTGRH